MIKDKSGKDGKEEGHANISQDEEETKAQFLVLICGEERLLKPNPVGGVEYLQNRKRNYIRYITY